MINYSLPASVTKADVLDCLSAIKRLTNNTAAVEVDCQAVTNFDSAGVALLLELTSGKSTPHCTLANISPAIRELCELYAITL